MRRSLAPVCALLVSACAVTAGARLVNAWSSTTDQASVATFGSTGRDWGHSTAVDSSGNLYLSGTFRGTVDFDPGPAKSELVASSFINSVYVVKLDSSGQFVWARMAAIAIGDEYPAPAVAVDTSGNVVVAGSFRGTVDFDPTEASLPVVASGNQEAFIWKLDSSGNLVWVRTSRGVPSSGGGGGGGAVSLKSDVAGVSAVGASAIASTYTTVGSVAIGPSGDITVGGSFSGTVDFDPDAGTTQLDAKGGNPLLVWRLSANGLLLWVKHMGQGSTDYAYDVAVDSNSHAYVTGPVYGTSDYDPGPSTTNLTAAGGEDTVVVKFDSQGGFLRAHLIGGSGNDYSWGVEVDSSNNVYVTGTFSGTADFDPGAGTSTLVSTDAGPGFVVTYSSTGDFRWVRSAKSTNQSLAVSSSGNVYVTGSFRTPADFDPGSGVTTLTPVDGDDVFLWGLTAAGDFLLARQAGGTGDSQGFAVAVDTTGNILVAGDFEGTAQFTSGTNPVAATSNGDFDAFLWSTNQQLPQNASGGTTTVPPAQMSTTSIATSSAAPTVLQITSSTPSVRVNKAITAKSIASSAKLTVAPTSKLTLRVQPSSAKNCKISGSSVKGLKAGSCKVTVTVTPKKGKATSKTITIKVSK